MSIPLSIIVLAVVLVLIAVRQVGRVRFQMWQAMALGAVAVLVAGAIPLRAALESVNVDVLLFLFGMFVIGQALEESGYLGHLAYRTFKRARSMDALLVLVIFGFGLASAILMNDTLAIIGTPVVLLLARKHDMPPRLLLLALAFAVTTGSVMSPIGNPQNLLIALNGRIGNPFAEFFRWLFIPTVVNLAIVFLVLRRVYRDEWHDVPLTHSQEPIHDRELAMLSRISLQMVLLLIAVKVLIVAFGVRMEFPLTAIALVSCLPILVGSRRRWEIVRRIDWATLVFFAAMFILMESVWRSGFFQAILARSTFPVTAPETVLAVSTVLSQFISNVPMVALYQPMLLHAGAGLPAFMALAAGSTLAGNVLILGAASNVIIVQNAEKRSHHTLSVAKFTAIGLPLTIVQLLVCWICFQLL